MLANAICSLSSTLRTEQTTTTKEDDYSNKTCWWLLLIMGSVVACSMTEQQHFHHHRNRSKQLPGKALHLKRHEPHELVEDEHVQIFSIVSHCEASPFSTTYQHAKWTSLKYSCWHLPRYQNLSSSWQHGMIGVFESECNICELNVTTSNFLVTLDSDRTFNKVYMMSLSTF